MVKMGDGGLDVRYGLMLEIHDDLGFECPDRHLDECLEVVPTLMQAPSPKLVDPEVAPQGLWCDVEANVGRNWDRRDSLNPEGMEKVTLT